jgi:hypothetical protein
MINRLKNKGSPVATIATNSAAPGDYELGSLESRAAARALIEHRRKQEKRLAFIWPVPRPDWFPSDHGQRPWPNGNCFEVFCADDPDYPRAGREAGSEGKAWNGRRRVQDPSKPRAQEGFERPICFRDDPEGQVGD